MKATWWDDRGQVETKAFALHDEYGALVHYVDGEVLLTLVEASDTEEMHLRLSPEEAERIARQLLQAAPVAANDRFRKGKEVKAL